MVGGYHRGDGGEELHAQVARMFGWLEVLTVPHGQIGSKLWHGKVERAVMAAFWGSQST